MLTSGAMDDGASAITRRVFVRGGAATLVFLAEGPTAWARSSRAAKRKALRRKHLTRSHFKPLVGAKVRMTGEGEDVHVVLAEVTNLVPVLRKDDPNRFGLLFKAPLNHPPAEGIRTFHHD